MSNTKIVLNRQSDLILDNAQITNPEGIVIADISGLVSTVASIDTKESIETSNRISNDESIAANLSTELVDRAAALSTEASLRVVGDVSVTAAMSAEISTRIVAETSLANDITAEASSRVVGDQAEESRAIAAEGSLMDAVNAEESRAIAAEGSLEATINNVISNVDPAALDSLTEIVGAFQSADGDLNGAIVALSSTATANLSAEASTRLAADGSIAANLSTELVDRAAALSTEEAARISGDESIALNLSSEVQARISDVDAEQARAESAEAVLTAGLSSELVARASAITNEASIRLAADNSIATNLSTELVNRASADSSIAAGLSTELVTRASAVSTEISARISGDASIAAGLSSELVARASGDASIAAGLSSELVTRASADASLATKLNAEISALPMTDGTTIIIDGTTNTIQLKEAVAAPTSGTRTFSGLINVAAQPATLAGFGDLSLVTKGYTSAAVSTEASTRLAADASIAAGLSSELVARAAADTAEASTRLTADNSIAANLSTELVDRAAAVSTEASIRLAADLSIDANLSTEKGRIDAILSASLADSDTFAEIVALINSVDTENDNAFAGYVLSNDAALSTEVSRAESAEASLDVAKLNLAGGTMLGSINMGGNNIVNAGLIFVDNLGAVGNTIKLSNNLDADGATISNLPAPTNDGDATNKLYVDSALSTELARAESAELSLGTDLGLGSKGDAVEWEVYIDGLANGYEFANGTTLNAGAFAVRFGPANLVNYTAFKAYEEMLRAQSAEASLDVAKLNLAGGAMSGNIAMNGNEIIMDNGIIEGAMEVWVSFLKGKDGVSDINLQSNLDAQSKSIFNLPTPTNDGDAANKLYVDSALSSEIARAESAEASIAEELSSEVSYIIANTDLTSIDSFAEVVADMSSEISRAESAEASIALDFANIYAKHVVVNETPNGTITYFTLATPVRTGSELIYLNGLLLDGGDYSTYSIDDSVVGFTFINAPSTGDKVRAYGVC